MKLTVIYIKNRRPEFGVGLTIGEHIKAISRLNPDIKASDITGGKSFNSKSVMLCA